MRKNVSTYNKATGRILVNMVATEINIAAQITENIGVVDGHHIAKQVYVLDELPVNRPAIPCTIDKTTLTADNVEYVTITGVPANAKIYKDLELLGTSDGTDIELSFGSVGEKFIKIELFPYIDWEVTINAN